MSKFRTLIRIIAPIDGDSTRIDGDNARSPVAVIPAWNSRKPVVLSSWPPGFNYKLVPDPFPHRCHGIVDLDAPDDTWQFTVEWPHEEG